MTSVGAVALGHEGAGTFEEVVPQPRTLGGDMRIQVRDECWRQIQAKDRIEDPSKAAVADLDRVAHQAAIRPIDAAISQLPVLRGLRRVDVATIVRERSL